MVCETHSFHVVVDHGLWNPLIHVVVDHVVVDHIVVDHVVVDHVVVDHSLTAFRNSRERSQSPSKRTDYLSPEFSSSYSAVGSSATPYIKSSYEIERQIETELENLTNQWSTRPSYRLHDDRWASLKHTLLASPTHCCQSAPPTPASQPHPTLSARPTHRSQSHPPLPVSPTHRCQSAPPTPVSLTYHHQPASPVMEPILTVIAQHD